MRELSSIEEKIGRGYVNYCQLIALTNIKFFISLSKGGQAISSIFEDCSYFKIIGMCQYYSKQYY